MALVNMCLEAGIAVHAAMVNYHHRKESDLEEAGVRQFCMEHGIALSVLNTPFESNGNFEADARAHRYDFFVQLVKQYGLKGVLIAHQEDDLLETYLMQKERHLVPQCYGLAEEMHYQGMLVKRPLLSFTKKQLMEYCDHHQIPYWIDSSNSDRSYTRNRMRIDVVSKMDREERDALLREIQEENRKLCALRKRAGSLILNGRVMLSSYRREQEGVRLTVLRMVLKDDHAGLRHLQQIDAVIRKKDSFEFRLKDRRLVSDGRQFFTLEPAESYSFTVFDLNGLLALKQQKYFRVENGVPGVNALSLKEADFPVTIRNWQVGDEIVMRFGRKSVHRFFIDRKIPLYLRSTWPVVLNAQGQVILVPGLGCSVDHFTQSPQICVLQ